MLTTLGAWLGTHGKGLLPAALALVLLLAGLVNLEAVPAFWWDEGWTLDVARYWVERGHYGEMLGGQPAPGGLAASLTVVAPIAASFRLLGVGVWQGRLVGVLFMLVTLALLYYVTCEIYSQRIAMGTIVVALLMLPVPDLHPVTMSRQVLADLPDVFFLLAGYASLLWDRAPRLLRLTAAAIFWGLALMTKAETLPFWALAMCIPLLLLVLRRQWKPAGLFGTTAVGSYLAWQLFASLQTRLLPVQPLAGYGEPLPELYGLVAIVPVFDLRLSALITGAIFGLPVLLGLGYATWRLIREVGRTNFAERHELVKVSLLFLAGSWFAWYVLLSNAFYRYLFPATLMGSIFAAKLLHDLTMGFKFQTTLQRGALAITERKLSRESAPAIMAIFLVMFSVTATLRMLGLYYFGAPDRSVFEAADFINTQTPPQSLVESYDSSLFFLVQRPYHYPPDHIHVELLKRQLLSHATGEQVSIDYDPLVANPDFVVVGPTSCFWHLYDPIVSSGQVQLVRKFGTYSIYQRRAP